MSSLLYLFGLLPHADLFLSSSLRSSSQSKDIGNLFGHILPSGVQIAQYLVCLGGMDEVGDCMVGVTIVWLGVGAWLDAVPATSMALRVASQFCCVARGKGLIFIFLGCESFSLFGLVSITRLHFLAGTLGFGWKELLAKGVTMICVCLKTLPSSL